MIIYAGYRAADRDRRVSQGEVHGRGYRGGCVVSTPAPSSRGPSKGRVEAFSDGVFAVAITLLVLDIALSHKAEPGELWRELGGLGYHYAAFAISFLTIGIMWVSHHRLMDHVERVDHGFLYRNLLLLGIISFIPFPTGVLSEYVHGEGETNMRAAVAIYGLTMLALSIAFTLLWLHVYRTQAIRAVWSSQPGVRIEMLRSGAAALVYVVATALAPVFPIASLVIFVVTVIVFVLARPRDEAVIRGGERAGSPS